MAGYFTESTYESAVIELFTTMGYTHIYAPDLNRTDYTSPLLDSVPPLLQDNAVEAKMYCYSLYNRV